MSMYMPDMYCKNIFEVDYEKLKAKGIKCLLFDLDNTIATKDTHKPSVGVLRLMNDLRDIGFIPVIFSNAMSNKRIGPFAKDLNIKVIHRVFKPYQYNYKKFLKKSGYKPYEVACIGDQLLTDVKGGNRSGFTTVFVDRLSPSDQVVTAPNRFIENMIINKMEKKGQFKRGKYFS